MKDIRDLDLTQITDALKEWGEPSFRAKQIYQWLWQKGATDFDAMTNLSKPLRDKLKENFSFAITTIHTAQKSSDGTIKIAFQLHDGFKIEGVLIPTSSRTTACVSSQVGCSLDCKFCATGYLKRERNLTAAEIVDQVRLINNLAEENYGKRLDNIVYMGMGEPLLNYEPVVGAMRLMLSDNAYGLSRRRVTLSTSGVVPMMDRLANDLPVALAVSLHAPNDALRDELVPINKKYPLKELMAACMRYLPFAPRDFLTFEYCMLDGVNDSDQHAKELVDLLKKIPCKLNLIPFNPFPGSGLHKSSSSRVQDFAKRLMDAGIITTVRKTRGDDIAAACGQLAGDVKDRTNVKQRMQVVKIDKGVARS